MIAVDTSALMAIVLGEVEADACIAALEIEDDILISAATIAEALIVAARRNVGDEMARLIDGLGFNAVAVTPAAARRVAGLCAMGQRRRCGRPEFWRLLRL
jgi:ribonuclease VapC